MSAARTGGGGSQTGPPPRLKNGSGRSGSTTVRSLVLALVLALACALLLLAAPARAAESQSQATAMVGKSIGGAISDIMKLAQANGKETKATVKERIQAQADAEVKGEEAVSDAGTAAENGITDSWAEGDASLQSLEHDDSEKVTAAADHQVANVRESTEQAKEDLERYTRRQQWVIGVAEQRAQVRLADSLDRAEKLDFDTERRLRFQERQLEKKAKRNEEETAARQQQDLLATRDKLAGVLADLDAQTKTEMLDGEQQVGEQQARAEAAADANAAVLGTEELDVLRRVRAAIDVASLQRVALQDKAHAFSAAHIVGRAAASRLALATTARAAHRRLAQAEALESRTLAAQAAAARSEAKRVRTEAEAEAAALYHSAARR